MMHWIAITIAGACAVLIAWRVMSVLNHLNFRNRQHTYWRWLMFGLSYSLLLIAVCGSTVQILEGRSVAGDWIWLLASAGLIAFDRRAGRKPRR